jgi:lysophospholipase L1-like esterase
MMMSSRRQPGGRRRRWSRAVRVLSSAAAFLVLPAVLAPAPAAAHSDRGLGRWTGAWATSMVAPDPDFPPGNWSGGFANHSVRQLVRVSRGGSNVRIRVSNVFGAAPLRLAGAAIGQAGEGASVRPGTLRPLTFGRSLPTVVPAGQEAVSDATVMRVAPLERLTVTLSFAAPTGPATFHPIATATSYRATDDHRFDPDGGAFGETSQSWYYLAGVEVAGRTSGQRGAVVAFGDSITDGTFSTPDANNRYPDELAERMVAAGRPMGVLNAGVAGNRVLASSPGLGERATARFQRDVLHQPGVRTVIVLEGINDIGFGEGGLGEPVTAPQLIEGYRALIRAAHARGIRLIGATITPSKGAIYPGYDTDRGEAVRDAVNRWVRTAGEYDAVVDFDRALADPTDPDRLRRAYDSGDGLHPNDAGMHAMAQAIDLTTL